MSNYNDDDFDKFLYQEIKRAAEGISVPDAKEAWAELEGKLDALMIKKTQKGKTEKVCRCGGAGSNTYRGTGFLRQ